MGAEAESRGQFQLVPANGTVHGWVYSTLSDSRMLYCSTDRYNVTLSIPINPNKTPFTIPVPFTSPFRPRSGGDDTPSNA